MSWLSRCNLSDHRPLLAKLYWMQIESEKMWESDQGHLFSKRSKAFKWAGSIFPVKICQTYKRSMAPVCPREDHAPSSQVNATTQFHWTWMERGAQAMSELTEEGVKYSTWFLGTIWIHLAPSTVFLTRWWQPWQMGRPSPGWAERGATAAPQGRESDRVCRECCARKESVLHHRHTDFITVRWLPSSLYPGCGLPSNASETKEIVETGSWSTLNWLANTKVGFVLLAWWCKGLLSKPEI